jgi:hypothetical protein
LHTKFLELRPFFTVAGLDPAIQPPRVRAETIESFRSQALATGWPALWPAMVRKGSTRANYPNLYPHDFPRIENIFRIECALQRAHNVEFRGAFVACDFIALHESEAVFGAD